ncbi:MAG TPA: PhzF family phenazine biosynthesis protein, partial [Sphingomonas sp.]|nr:PhzF family phenazine biosynthesis protein [Sphingomonas sp.]
MRIPFTQVDAFADRPFAGNPAAVMLLDGWLDDATLQHVAAENNLSETAFLVPEDGNAADYELRWFTPSTEVVLCGHATLASGHVVLSAERGRERVRFSTRKAGMLEVAREGDGYALALPAWAPNPKPLPAIVAALGLEGARETLWHPHGYGLIVVENEEMVRGLAPDFRALAAEGDILTIVTAPGRDADVVSRVFACGAGIDEDPVTGSAHAVMTPYWAERLGRNRFTAFQASPRGGRLECRLE